MKRSCALMSFAWLSCTLNMAFGSDIELELLDGFPNGYYLINLDVSSDGSVIAGTYHLPDSEFGNFYPFLWKNGQLNTDLFDSLGITTGGIGSMSGNGEILVGSFDTSGNQRIHLLDTTSGAEIILAEPPEEPDGFSHHAWDVSGDGSVFAGVSTFSAGEPPFVLYKISRWSNGIIEQSEIMGQTPEKIQISSDGSTIIVSFSENSFPYISRWTFGEFTTIDGNATSYAVSRDGAQVVGIRNVYIPFFSYAEAMLWDNGQTINLPTPLETTIASPSSASAISGDGSLIVGSQATGSTSIALLWSRTHDWSFFILDEFLDASGIDRNGFHLSHPLAISDDGTSIVGKGIHGNGEVGIFHLKLAIETLSFGPYPAFYGYADTGQWMGMLYIANDPWVYSFDLVSWIYLPEQTRNSGHGWVWIPGEF